MPDLNYTNPAVTAEMQNVVRFWLQDVGVDGFRLDAAKHLIEEGRVQAHTAATHAWWKALRPIYKQINPQAVTVGELWDTLDLTAPYLQGDELDLAFEFNLADAFVKSADNGNSGAVNNQIKLSYKLLPPLQFAPFLTNHDQNRVMTRLGKDPEKAKVAASLLLTAPGVPFLYYGEEIGMQGEKPDEQIRRPMQWCGCRFAGFTTWSPWEPLGPAWESFNVTSETGDTSSILSHYRTLIQARSQHAALRVGDLSVVTAGNSALYAILRVSQEEAVLVLVNLTGEPVTDYRLALVRSTLAEGSYTPAAIMGEGSFAPLSANASGGFSRYVPVPEVPPYATFILQLQPTVP
jgi:glycosidase